MPPPDSVPLLPPPPPPPGAPGSTREPLSKRIARALFRVLDPTSNGTRVTTTTLNLRVALSDLPSESATESSTSDTTSTTDHMRIVFLSDIHFNGAAGGPATSGGTFACAPGTLVQSAVDAVNAADADVVLLGGDLVDGDGGCARELADRYLAQLRARCGIWAVLGNHDQFLPGARTALVHALHTAGIAVLDNAVVRPLPHLEIVGLGDVTTPGDFCPDAAFSPEDTPPAPLPSAPLHSVRVPEDARGIYSPRVAVGGRSAAGAAGTRGLAHCRVVVTHSPDAAPQLMGHAAHLQLSGHTHGGQVCLPTAARRPVAAWLYEDCGACCGGAVRTRVWPVYRSFAHWEWVHGLHLLFCGDPAPETTRFLYVTRGIGSHTPGRFFCPPEVVVVNIETVYSSEESVK